MSQYQILLNELLHNPFTLDHQSGGKVGSYSKSLNKEKSRALSTIELDKLLEGKTKILTYPTLTKHDNIMELLDPYNSFVLLYLTQEKYGHYCAVCLRNNKICFFDPYGDDKMPDQQLNFIDKDFRVRSNQDYPYLTKLLYESNYPIEYNDHQYQQKGANIATCGRHCACFIMSGLDIDQYYDFMKQLKNKYKMSYDDIVTKLTSNKN